MIFGSKNRYFSFYKFHYFVCTLVTLALYYSCISREPKFWAQRFRPLLLFWQGVDFTSHLILVHKVWARFRLSFSPGHRNHLLLDFSAQGMDPVLGGVSWQGTKVTSYLILVYKWWVRLFAVIFGRTQKSLVA